MPSFLARAAALISRAAHASRRILGVPDYDGYLAHLAQRHPGRVPIARDDFLREMLARRYERPGSRCC